MCRPWVEILKEKQEQSQRGHDVLTCPFEERRRASWAGKDGFLEVLEDGEVLLLGS